MKIILKIIAILLTNAFAYLGINFSNAVEPESFNVLVVIFFLAFGGFFQLGLFLSTIKLGEKYKLVTGILMLPCLIFLLATNYDMLVRLISGNPIPSIASIVYFLGLLAYLYSYTNLFVGKRHAI